MNRTHFRKAYKSDHLGVPDLEELQEADSNLIFTIKEVKYELGARVAGNKGDFNICYFKESIKPLVLNATNSKVLSKLSKSSFIEDWVNLKIQLLIDRNVKFKGDIVDGVRISKNPPKVSKYKLVPGCDKWNDAIEGAKTMTLEQMRKHFDISEENYALLKKVGADSVA
jgi:hypothetical protein